MGLDMYLTRKKYIGGKYSFNEVKGNIDISVRGQKIPIDIKRLQYIVEEVGYWRKANQIHNWFIENVNGGIDNNCETIRVRIEQLEDLLKVCKEVKSKAILKSGKIKIGEQFDENNKVIPIYKNGKYIENEDEIEDLLPTQEGFFFGSTDYDEFYMEDIDNTIEILEKVLQEEEELNKLGIYSEFEYYASW